LSNLSSSELVIEQYVAEQLVVEHLSLNNLSFSNLPLSSSNQRQFTDADDEHAGAYYYLCLHSITYNQLVIEQPVMMVQVRGLWRH